MKVSQIHFAIWTNTICNFDKYPKFNVFFFLSAGRMIVRDKKLPIYLLLSNIWQLIDPHK